MSEHGWRGRILRAVTGAPFRDEHGRKGWMEGLSRPQPHVVRRIEITLDGLPRWPAPLRIAFLTDFHTGCHSADVARLGRILGEAASHAPDLVLFGGDYVNMQIFGGGRVPPRVIAGLLGRLNGRTGRFAVLGNHDYYYDANAVACALRDEGIVVLDHERRTFAFENHAIDIIGIPDAHVTRPQARQILSRLSADRPAIVLAHDPAWFAGVPAGPFLMLAGHTHGGQIRLPGFGPIVNSSKAPLRWTHGLVREGGRCLYVCAGLGTSGIPLRIGVPPEFAIIELNGA